MANSGTAATRLSAGPALTRGRRGRAPLAALLVCVAWGALACAGGPSAGARAAAASLRPLHVLLTNDDGIDGVGLQALKRSLREAGHRVTVVAPSRNFSGSSASVTFGAVQVREVGPGEYAAEASPATCVLLGLTAFADPEAPFDLVVSGTNDGANVGPATGISGTVGATTIAAGGIGNSVAAIAVSANPPSRDPNDPRYAPHFEHVAEFAVRLVDALRIRPGERGALLPPGIRLNVNYPARAAADVKGVMVGVQGRVSPFGLSFEQKAPGVYSPKFAAPDTTANDVAGSDTAALADGYITIVALDTDYTAGVSVRNGIAARLTGLSATAAPRP